MARRAGVCPRFAKSLLEGRTAQAYWQEDEPYYEWTGTDDVAYNDLSSVMVQEDGDDDEGIDEGQDYYEDEAFLTEPNDSVYDVDEYDHVLANYQDAKARLNAMRTSRGFFPVVAMMPNQMPHSPSSSPARGKGRGKGKQKSKGKTSPSSPRMEWEDLPSGSRGEHLTHLGKDIRQCIHDEPQMILIPDDTENHVGDPIAGGVRSLLDEANLVDGALDAPPEPIAAVTQGGTHSLESGKEEDDCGGHVRRLQPHVLRKMERGLQERCNEADRVLKVGGNISKKTKMKVVWEVFVGTGRTTKHLEKYKDVQTEIFSLQTGWDFQLSEHRAKFLARLRAEKPDEVLMSPMCRLWSPLQELNIAQSEEYKIRLMEQ
eukprot:Skav224903  [mRNA]  locus=scaffold1112:428999:432383:- [translate_table: standard]